MRALPGADVRIALASCSSLTHWEVDDRPLHTALEARAIEISRPAWDDPTIRWDRFDAVLVRTTWDYTARLDDFLAWIHRVAQQVPLLNPARLIRWNTHKSYLRDLERWGVPVVPTVWVAAGESVDLDAVLRTRGWRRGFLKPAVGASSEGTRRVTQPASAADQAHLDQLTSGAMVQPYRASVEDLGETSVLIVAGQVTHGVRKIPPPGDYRVQDDYGAHDEPWADTAAAHLAKEAVTELASRLGVEPLVARVDMLQGPTGPEVNELELVEPSLFLRHAPHAADTLADALLDRLNRPRRPRRRRPRPRQTTVVFDLDGTLLDSTQLVVDTLQHVRGARGLPPVDPAQVRARIGIPLRQMVAELSLPDEDVDVQVNAYKTRFVELALISERPFAGILELLVDLRVAGTGVGIATGKSQAGAIAATGRHRLGHWVAEIHGIVPGTPGKPHPAVLERALAGLGAAPGESLFIGDTTFDMEVARRAGVPAAGVVWGVHTANALTGAGAQWVAHSVGELRERLLIAPVT